MVDALHRAHSVLDSGGIVVDVHPTPEPAHLDVAMGSGFVRLADRLDDPTASGPSQRHTAADDAVTACLTAGIFTLQAAAEFTFRTHADTVEELLVYVRAKWKQLHFA